MNNPNFMTSLARGLDVIRRLLGREAPHVDRPAQTGIGHAAVRRRLFTLAVPLNIRIAFEALSWGRHA